MPVTIKDVAQDAGVSSSTVSRVMSDDPRISQETRIKVLDSIKRLDYKINPMARGLKTNRTYLIGFVCPELVNDFFMHIAQGVEQELKKKGYHLLVTSSNEDIMEEDNQVRMLLDNRVDGIIIIPVSGEGEHFNIPGRIKTPMVLMDRLVRNFTTDSILCDNINGTYSAMEYMITQGYRRIGFIGGDMELTSARERYEGYKRALRDYQIPLEEEMVLFGDFHIQSGYEMMKRLLSIENPPESIFVSNYFMQVGASRFLLENRKGHLPFMAGFDDMELTSVLGLSQITVTQPMKEMGITAANLLINRISGFDRSLPRIIRLKPRLCISKNRYPIKDITKD